MTRTPAVLAFYEIHHWPAQGRLLVVDKAAYRDLPVLTWLEVAAAAGTGRADATVVIAHRLGSAAALDGADASVVLHDGHGNMLATPGGLGLPAVVLRRAR